MDPLHATIEDSRRLYLHRVVMLSCRVIRLGQLSGCPESQWVSPSRSFQKGCAAPIAVGRPDLRLH
jgi:hypothetical protein